MPYDYRAEKASLFTEQGADTLLKVRDEAFRLIDLAGACTISKAIAKATGNTWTMLAAVDFLVERGELRRVQVNGPTQDQLLVRP